MVTLGLDGGSGDRRLFHSLQQHTRSIFNPVIKAAGHVLQVTYIQSLCISVHLLTHSLTHSLYF